jgi:tetratricopeptide (TPR) repeat protein
MSIEAAKALYEQAVFGGNPAAVEAGERELEAAEAELALTRGQLMHARFLSERVVDERELTLFQLAEANYRELGDGRGQGSALFWIGCYHQVVQGDAATALPFLERAARLAEGVGDRLTLSYALRHLAFAAHEAGDLDTAWERMSESTRLRRELDFRPGLAANLSALAFLALDRGRPEEAKALVEEATGIAEACAAHGVLRWIEEVRARL